MSTVTVDGYEVQVHPLTVAQWPAVARALRPILPALGGDMEQVDWWALLADHGEHLIEAVTAAVDFPAEVIGAMPPDEFITLAMEVAQVNADFFTQRVAPALATAAQRMTGTTLPSASSSTATPPAR